MTTYRSDLVVGVRTVLLAQQTATPTRLRAVYNARPGSFPETPCAYIGPRDETITLGGQLMTRTFSGLTVVLVDALQDASETEDRLDDLVDLLVTRFAAAYAQVAGGNNLLNITGAADTDIILDGPTGPVTYRGVVLSFGTTFSSEGRT